MAAAFPFRRSAAYINKLRDIANAQASLKLLVGAEKHMASIETRRSEDIEYVYKYIEGSARVGAVRIFDWEWSTPSKIRELVFKDQEIKNYLERNGFSYADNCVEWYHASAKTLA
jgi:hypothetical protein